MERFRAIWRILLFTVTRWRTIQVQHLTERLLAHHIKHRRRHLAHFQQVRQTHAPQEINVNEVHQATMDLNDRIALATAGVVGTMYFCYGIAGIIAGWALLQAVLGHHAFDAYPYAFLFFCLGGIMQSLLMPLLMVAQNLSNRLSELRAEADYHVNQATFTKLESLEEIVQRIVEHSAKQAEQQDAGMHAMSEQLADVHDILAKLVEQKTRARKSGTTAGTTKLKAQAI